MIDLDKWSEIFESIKRHKLRTALTALGVFWGIFMLVILLGAGQGLQNGIEFQFEGDATNSIRINGGWTSKAYKGLPKGRRIYLNNEDIAILQRDFPEVEDISGRVFLQGNQQVRFKDKVFAYSVRGVSPAIAYLEQFMMVQGRFLNDGDDHLLQKNAVIGTLVKEELFGKDGDAVGKEINIGGIVYQVVGVYYDKEGERSLRDIYIPITLAQRVYQGTDYVNNIWFSTAQVELEQAKSLENRIRRMMSAKYLFDPEDMRAMWISNALEEYQNFQNLFAGIKAFLWFVGLGSLLAGVIGVSNIMLIIVKDRTREIGVRKALGATPGSIVNMILSESIFITLMAGYFGMILGLMVLYFASSIQSEFFRQPEIHLSVGLLAIVILTIAGALAGWVPARQASRINPVIAMKAR
ncbi:MAG TPA: ABC transporter permease [Saprospiraceae bacterium]|nr:ABC transporter permease [Saprospiraceae bacterium]MCB9271296.1 ABC transporter permease [Lewinellaceae bacterium]HPG07776.1 ABC transporter permease [Saprospiraceae bacterium]HPQ98838.1 ABC transporter permease [Saprospiraceae bacterium]HRV84465.1 ABC transporter permease [Saprospiraceae bacterium]